MDKLMTTVVVDAMGGDNAPGEIIKGAVDAVNADKRVKVILAGKKDIIEAELKKYTYDSDRLCIHHASEVIETAEPPVMAIRTKKDSSIVSGLMLVKKGEADAFVSAGSSGAVLVGGYVIVGRLKGVDRPPLASIIPSMEGISLLVDCGANMDSKPQQLVQYAKMGSIYMEHVLGVSKPRVAIVNVGAEEEKGNALVKETFPLLKECDDINFIGSIEAREIPFGQADVIVCDAFVGNVILKLYEGTGKFFLKKMKTAFTSNIKSKLGALLVKESLKDTLKQVDASNYGGAPFLGLKGLVVKTHGSANDIEIKNSILQCVEFTEQKISEKIAEKISQ
jgi:glycerol-3-phosphate acyltransferase PlsX